jgi:hypothetical protein
MFLIITKNKKKITIRDFREAKYFNKICEFYLRFVEAPGARAPVTFP